MAALWPPLWWVVGAALLLYAMLGLFFSVKQALRHGLRLLPLIPIIFLVLHLAWGLGFWRGLFFAPSGTD